eukprot:gb/GECG01009703.1/.p1 GENE.gb/GECG01009703.1/~~gb/GECG01009703.1/.p1  ORF type:complete len:492 (+),score=45.19 gb/GECG01009703.1/:1-1476(+)
MNQSDIAVHQVPHVPILVDGFLHGSPSRTEAYFLTHFHGDHYQGLDETFDFGGSKIVCSKITGSLCRAVLGIPEDRIISLPLDTPVLILLPRLRNAFFVSLTDANHCPGATMLLFEVPKSEESQKLLFSNGQELCGPSKEDISHSRVQARCLSESEFTHLETTVPDKETSLHSGDMRYHKRMLSSWTLKRCSKRLDRLYLDSTYARPRHSFVSQEDAIAHIDETVKQYETEGTRNLYIVCTYLVGKERILLKLAKTLCTGTDNLTGNKIWLSAKKMRILDQLNLGEDEYAWFTTDKSEARIFVVNMQVAGKTFPFFQPDFDRLRCFLELEYPRFNRIVAFVPTGWVNSSKQKTLRFGPVSPRIGNGTHKLEDIEEGNFRPNKFTISSASTEPSEIIDGFIHLVPYSEHSSYAELKEFISSVRPVNLIPTVYSNQRDQDRIRRLFSSHLDNHSAKKKFLQMFQTGTKRQNAGSRDEADRNTKCARPPDIVLD